MTDRVYDRVPLSFEVEYRTAGAFLVAYSSNLSKGGLFIETDRPLAVGTELMLRFSIPDSGTIEVRGHVAWVRPSLLEGKAPGMGVEFEHLDARHGEIIDHVVASFRGLTLLLVSSSVAARALLIRAVRSILSSAEVVEAATAEAAEIALKHKPDLVVVDLDDDDASENFYALRLARSTGQVSVIAISRDDETRARARELGADEALPSPVIITDLQASILRLLGRPMRVG